MWWGAGRADQSHMNKNAVISLLAGALVLVTAAASPAGVRGKTCPAHDATTFAACWAGATAGDTISLADGTYPTLLQANKRQFDTPVTISGSSAAVLTTGLTLSGTSGVVLNGFTVSPSKDQRLKAKLRLMNGARDITVEGVKLDGTPAPLYGVGLALGNDVSQITIEKSTFTRCGDAGAGYAGRCIDVNGSHIDILDNTFTDNCFGCKMIHGDGTFVTVKDNYLGSVVHTPGCRHTCQHLEQIHLEGAPIDHWVIDSNVFGDCGYNRANGDHGNCTANIFDGLGAMTNVEITNNLFTGVTQDTVFIADYDARESGIVFANNTCDQASPNTGSCIRIGPNWPTCSGSKCALTVANNIEAIGGGTICTKANTVANLVESGTACPGDATGSAALDGSHAPTSSSLLVIDDADAALAPSVDLFDHSRGRNPDRGAIEYEG
jgi:hypothetical protein